MSVVYTDFRNAECRYAECRYAECRYTECRYAECRYTECRGVLIRWVVVKIDPVVQRFFRLFPEIANFIFALSYKQRLPSWVQFCKYQLQS